MKSESTARDARLRGGRSLPYPIRCPIRRARTHVLDFWKAEFAQFLADRESILPWLAEYSPYALVRTDAPPVCLFYGAPPAIGQDQNDPTHTANFGVKLQERCNDLGVQCEVVYPGSSGAGHKTPTDYLITTLKARAGEPQKR